MQGVGQSHGNDAAPAVLRPVARACYAAARMSETSARRTLPWDIHPALTEDRLRLCARLLAHARRDAVRLASFEMGDNAWSVGCRAYAFGQQRIRRTAGQRTYNWLSVLDESNSFVFLIQDVPVRFFRGSADEPTARALRRQQNEADQLTLALGRDEAHGLAFRLALEADAAGRVERVVFLALRGEEGRVECFWPVPLDEEAVPDARPDASQLFLLTEDGVPPAEPEQKRRASRRRAG